MCWNVVIYAMPSYVPTDLYLFTYVAYVTIWIFMLCHVMCLHNLCRLFHAFSHIFHLVPVLCLEYFSCATTRKQLNVQDRFISKYSTTTCFLRLAQIASLSLPGGAGDWCQRWEAPADAPSLMEIVKFPPGGLRYQWMMMKTDFLNVVNHANRFCVNNFRAWVKFLIEHAYFL